MIMVKMILMMMMMNDENDFDDDENDDGYDVDDEGLEKGLRQGSQAEQSSNHTKLLCNAHTCTIAQMCTYVHIDNGTLEQLHRAHDLVVDLHSIVHRCSHCVVGSSLLHRYIGCSLCIVSSVGCSLLYAWLYGWSCMVGYSSLLGRILVFPAIFSHRHW